MLRVDEGIVEFASHLLPELAATDKSFNKLHNYFINGIDNPI
jgi:hypothetical protein